MTNAEQVAGRRWTCVDALYEMFFSDVDKDRDDISAADIRSFIKKRLSESSATSPNSRDNDCIEIGNKVDALLNIESHLESQPTTNRITWFRFGFLAQRHNVALSNTFVNRFGRWRFRLSLTGISHTVLDSASRSKLPYTSFKIENDEFTGYTMDYFFHCADKLPLFTEKVDWQLVRVNTTELHETKSVAKTESTKRSVKDIVGANNYNKIEKCISVAAKDATFPAIKNAMVDGRYQCKVTRDELVVLLLNRFRESITQSESTLRRTLSCFILFPNAWQRIDEQTNKK